MNRITKNLVSILLITTLISVNSVSAQQSSGSDSISQPETARLETMLFDLPDVRFKRTDDVQGFPAYLLNVKQRVDHNNLHSPHFYQTVLLVHRGFDRPTVINTNGYNLESRPMELFGLLESNFVSVEHRYFGPSSPSPKDWKHLTIEQACADYHRVKLLLGQIYDQKWISTGISKGGETATYFRHFYPDDVDITVAYVAPFPIGLKDQRFYKFLATKGTEECRKKIFTFQKNVLLNKSELVPRLKYYLKGKGAKVELIGGVEAALELFVLEYPFSFWQSGKNCEDVPDADASPEDLLDHLVDSGDFWYLLDDQTEGLAAHYYQHATQLGYYGYQTARFGDLIKKWGDEPSACFFPYDKNLKFDPSVRNRVIDWLKTDAEDIVFIYGGTDTWTVAQAELGDNRNIQKFVLPDRHHGTARIKRAEKETREKILELINEDLNK